MPGYLDTSRYLIINFCECTVSLFFSTCVSRCPPRSFPNKGGVCWPCHESCETCAGAGQDSCLTCAPAHLRVTDLAVCLQQCPDGYFESNYLTDQQYIFNLCRRSANPSCYMYACRYGRRHLRRLWSKLWKL